MRRAKGQAERARGSAMHRQGEFEQRRSGNDSVQVVVVRIAGWRRGAIAGQRQWERPETRSGAAEARMSRWVGAARRGRGISRCNGR
ncbi:hypothetical protein Syun_021803 [Stephania yunnanensis]|uniref:Uncharacterized protein n=1 Tax=Stephania yunnanensis TaxID=152371 RepID=A0AAP0IHQ4_9MAGN